VHRHEHAGRDLRQDVQEERRDVRVHEHPMRSVDQQDIIGGEPIEDPEVDGFEGLPDQLVADAVDLSAGLRVDRHDAGPKVAVAAGAPCEQRRVARADLEVQVGCAIAQKAVDRRSVEAWEPAVHPRGLERVIGMMLDPSKVVHAAVDRCEGASNRLF
jgi:hypothetical protein